MSAIKLGRLKKKFPKLLWLFAFISFFNFFIESVNDFLARQFVNPLLSTYDNTVFNSGLLIFFSISIAVWLWNFGDKFYLRVLAGSTIWFYLLMLKSNYWVFIYLNGIPFLRVWDIVVIGLAIPILRTLRNSKKDSTHETNEGFIEDMPILEDGQDSFRRSGLSKEIAYKISITRNKRSFAIGIIGDYGSGKSSFINLVKSHLDLKKNEIIDYNPWSAESSSNIQQDFFDLLAARLYELDPKISSLLLDYSRKLSRADSIFEQFIKKIGFASGLIIRSNYADDYSRINNLLAVSGKKIVVTIDDVDRLYKEEVLEVLRLVRNTANFTNIVYLLAYERGYIDIAVSSLNENVSSSYLDKIIQLEIPLPKREQGDLLDMLSDKLNGFISAEDMKTFQTHIISTGFQNEYDFNFKGVFRQSRDVIKFLNSFKISHSKLTGEVLFENIFVLELLKYRFPLVYDRLYEDKGIFIQDQAFSSPHNQYYELKTYNEDKERRLIAIRTLRGEGKYNESELLIISGLLSHLFFRFDRSKAAKNSIIYPMYFERYFRYRLGTNEISESKFRNVMYSNYDALIEFIDAHSQRKVIKELTVRLFQESPKNREEFELLVKSLFYIGPKFLEENGRRTFDYEALINILWNHEGRIEKQFYNNDKAIYKVFLNEMLSNASFPFLFHHELVSNLKRDYKSIGISKEQIIEYQVQYFRRHVQENGLSEDSIFMFWWTDYNEFVPIPSKPNHGHEHRHIEPLMVKAIKEVLPLYDPAYFLKHSINYDMWEKSLHGIQKEIIEIFDTPSNLKELVAGHPLLNAEIRDEYLNFFDAWNQAGSNTLISYDFNTMLRPKRMNE